MNRIQELKEIISKAMTEISEIQEDCSHPRACLTKKYGSNTGNYDPSSDCYWIDWKCSLCGKAWTTDQDRENTMKDAGTVIRG